MGMSSALLVICFLHITRVLLKNQKAAIAASILFVALLFAGRGSMSTAYAIGLILASIYIFVLIRFGLAAVAFVSFTRGIFEVFPATLDVSAWYSGYGFAALAVFMAIVLYAFRTSLGGRPLLAPSRLDD
jgi:hypothetical protein